MSRRITALVFAIMALPAAATPPVWGADDGFRPFDILDALRAHFRDHLPMNWYIQTPEKRDYGYNVRVNIPPSWGGNPGSAVRDLCPQPYSLIWQHIEQLSLTPFYQKRAWPEVECR
jgi:hypothetical protein